METKPISWQEVEKHLRELAVAIAPLKPEALIGVSRGGLPLVTMLSHLLRLPHVSTIEAVNYDNHNRLLPKNDAYFNVSPKAHDLMSLPTTVVIDDIYDSGRTFSVLNKLYPNPTYVALYRREHARWPSTMTLYWAQIAPSNTWLAFPWELQNVS